MEFLELALDERDRDFGVYHGRCGWMFCQQRTTVMEFLESALKGSDGVFGDGTEGQ